MSYILGKCRCSQATIELSFVIVCTREVAKCEHGALDSNGESVVLAKVLNHL
jgi:hypothetical protein